ncbi:MAG: hypothetical protein M1337_00515 [Actinobacteria bacterium]|nr:hypothetical protein [Actinomycetota bacterium]
MTDGKPGSACPAGEEIVGPDKPARQQVLDMKTTFLGFGRVEIDSQLFDHDVVIDAGKVRTRRKKPSKQYRGEYGHTPLSAEERIPWGGKRLIVATGTYGSLPIMPAVYEEAERRGVEVVALPTEEACALIRELDAAEVFAVLHVTC